jgi:hypothetical protein
LTYEVESGADICLPPHEHQISFTQEELSLQEQKLLSEIETLRRTHASGSKVRFVVSPASYYNEDDIDWAEVVCHVGADKVRLRQGEKIFDISLSKVYQVRSHY